MQLPGSLKENLKSFYTYPKPGSLYKKHLKLFILTQKMADSIKGLPLFFSEILRVLGEFTRKIYLFSGEI